MAEPVSLLAPDQQAEARDQWNGHEEPCVLEHVRPLELEQARVVDRGRLPRAVDGHDDGQADDDGEADDH